MNGAPWSVLTNAKLSVQVLLKIHDGKSFAETRKAKKIENDNNMQKTN
jgi:hypothetical protein